MPLQRGGGTRIKALEAIAWGLPVVATARAVEGLGLENAIHVSIAETGKEFVSAICDLCENPARYEAQRIAARRFILKVFGQDAIRTAVHSALREALQARPNTSPNGEHQWGERANRFSRSNVSSVLSPSRNARANSRCG
jgi:glycosyltransferase involved in cell wall biosynthesis